jgi:hypothetical protein
MIFAINRRAKYSVGILMLLFSSCSLAWRNVVSFSSPSEKYKVEVQQPEHWREIGARVVLKSAQSSKVVSEFRGDAYITFVHCWWSPDESTFTVFIAGTVRMIAAYDVVNGRTLNASDGKHRSGMTSSARIA